jgi:alpha-D-xyloside xylohydrolase
MVDYYLPAGRWTNFMNGQVIEGGRWLREKHGYLSLPLLARPNSVIAAGAVDDRPDYDYADGVTLHVFEPEDGAVLTVTIPDLSGAPAASFEVRREGDQLTARRLLGSQPWALVMRGQRTAAEGDILRVAI